MDMKTYKVKTTVGTTGNTEWWTTEDWENHRKFVEKSKVDGTYGTEVEYNFSLVPNHLFDDANKYPKNQPMESYRFELVDLSKY
jgi:hypothetical protein